MFYRISFTFHIVSKISCISSEVLEYEILYHFAQIDEIAHFQEPRTFHILIRKSTELNRSALTSDVIRITY